MLKDFTLLSVVLWVAIGVTSYMLIVGTQADWWQLVTYIWIFFWPFVPVLVIFYYSPIPFATVLTALIIAAWIWRRRRPVTSGPRHG